MDANMKKIIVLLIGFSLLPGCGKAPDKPVRPNMSIEVRLEDKAAQYIVKITTGIQNENNDLAIRNMSGEIVLSDSAPILILPFRIPMILPYETYELTITRTGDEEKLQRVFEYAKVETETIIERGIIDGITVRPNDIILRNLDYEFVNIYKLLKTERIVPKKEKQEK